MLRTNTAIAAVTNDAKYHQLFVLVSFGRTRSRVGFVGVRESFSLLNEKEEENTFALKQK